MTGFQIKFADILQYLNYKNPEEMVNQLYMPIQEWIYRTGQHPIVVGKNATLEEVIDKILTNHVHRVFVVDDQFKLIKEISLCDIIAQFVM